MKEKLTKKIISVILCVLMLIPACMPFTVGAEASEEPNTDKAALVGTIRSSLGAIPAADRLVDGTVCAVLADVTDIQTSPSATLGALADEVGTLNVKSDKSLRDALAAAHGQDLQTVDSLMYDLQSDTSALLRKIAKIADRFDNSAESKHDDCLQQLQIAGLASDGFDDYLHRLSLAQSYIADDNLLVNCFNACCNDAMLGGEAAIMASGYVNALASCLESAYLAADLVLGANAYVCHNAADYNKLKSTDSAFAGFNSDTFADEAGFTDSVGKLMTEYNALFGKNHATNGDNVILRGAIGRYNKMVRELWFYYIADCDYTASPAKISFVPLEAELTYSIASDYGYRTKLNPDISFDDLRDTAADYSKQIDRFVNAGLDSAQLQAFIEHISSSPYFGTENNSELTLEQALTTYGFSLEKCHGSIEARGGIEKFKTILATGVKASYESADDISVYACGPDMQASASTAAENAAAESLLFEAHQGADGTEYKTDNKNMAVLYFESVRPINNEKEFIELLSAVANGDSLCGRSYKLTADLDLSGIDLSLVWPDDKCENAFCGNFDGNEHTISNVSISSSGDRVGLFRTLGEGAIIQNLYLDNVHITANGHSSGCAALVGHAGGNGISIRYVDILSGEVSGSSNVAGIVGESEQGKIITIVNCKNCVAVSAANAYAGGIIASSGDITIKNCDNTAPVSGNGGIVGGICGYAGGEDIECVIRVTDCGNSGAVLNTDGQAAGIIGEVGCDSTENNITANANTADVSSTDNAGGVIAYMAGGGTICDNTNSGSIVGKNADKNTGGICGTVQDDSCIFDNCLNKGEVYADGNAGGIVGYVGDSEHDKTFTFTGNKNSGTVKSAEKSAGGICGILDSDNANHLVSGNSNEGSVTGHGFGGGIIAYMAGGGKFNKNSNSGIICAETENCGGIIGEIQNDMCYFKGSENSGEITVQADGKLAGQIVGWDGGRGYTIDNDLLYSGTLFGSGIAVIALTVLSLLVIVGAVVVIFFDKKRSRKTDTK